MLSEIAQFVNWVRGRNATARTWRDYSYDLRQFAEITGDRPPGEVTFRDVDRFVAAQRERGYQAATVNRRLAAILAFYSYLADEDSRLTCPVIPRRHFLSIFIRQCAGHIQQHRARDIRQRCTTLATDVR